MSLFLTNSCSLYILISVLISNSCTQDILISVLYDVELEFLESGSLHYYH